MVSVIIQGAGVIGTILSLVLSKLTKGDLKIFLIERNSLSYYDSNSLLTVSDLPPYIIALSKGGYSELIRIHEDIFLSSCIDIIKRIEISEWNSVYKVLIDPKNYQLLELGYVINLNIFRKELLNLVHKESAITICCPAQITKIIRNKYNNVIILDNKLQISAELIVAADGAHSTVATNCGMHWLQKDYQQIAIVTKIVTEIPHFGQAFEKFTVFGSLALLPISENISFVIWCISNKKKEEIIKWDSNKFSRELQDIFGWTLGKILNVEQRYFYDLWLIQAKSHILHRLVLVGNAAQNLHPIAGQGFNLGLRDVIVLAKIIVQAFYNDKDIGDYSILQVYQEKRHIDQQTILRITNWLVYLCNNECLSLVIARKLGLLCLSYNVCLQRLLVHSLLYWNTD